MLKTILLQAKVLITGADGFTGRYLTKWLKNEGAEVHALAADLLDRDALNTEIKDVSPDYVIHLAAVSFTAEKNREKIYSVNVLGAENLLNSLSSLNKLPKKIILASSASVYGNQEKTVLDEGLRPNPVSHYACSKLNMELLSLNCFQKLNILNVRLFNYTGVGQPENFIIPKLVNAVKRNEAFIELGNIDVKREFNDVRDVCKIYCQLLVTNKIASTVNLCSSNSISLKHVIENLNNLSGYEIEIRKNIEFVRENEIWDLSGSAKGLSELIDLNFEYNIEDTIKWMYLN